MPVKWHYPQGLKPGVFVAYMYGLKPVPFKRAFLLFPDRVPPVQR